MVFASLVFLYIFLPANLILYYGFKNAYYRNVLLTIFSLVFYAWGEPVWISLLMFSALIDYLNALFIERYRDTHWAKIGVVSSVIVNIGLLMVFKYCGFFYQNLNSIFGMHLKVPDYTLPVGISFYTFQTVSYVIDVYRKQVTAQRSYLKFLMFVSLYHQLVAGPIVRYAHIAHEIDNRRFNIGDISAGISRFCIGLFKKIGIANIAAIYVKKYMDGNLNNISITEAWFGLLMFTIQIYFDFSGYSDMAIGLGKMFGFHYHENFKYPYMARSATDFWRRWHISLGTFFRDYLYIPLGGNKRRAYFNLFVVWFATGMWHGASWNFILWGLYFGILIAIERLFLGKVLKRLPALGHIYLLIAVILGWALFYYTDFNRLLHFLQILFGAAGNPLWNIEFGFVFMENILWLGLAVLLCFPIYPIVNRKLKRTMVKYRGGVLFWLTGPAFDYFLLFLSTAMMVGVSYNPFIYYRF